MKALLTRVSVVLACLFATACDGSHSGSSAATTSARTASSGAAVFAHSCANCHSLVGNESQRKQGGDLLGYRLTRAQITSFTRVMPARLSPAGLRAVVDYLFRLEHGARSRGLLGLPSG